MGYKSSPPSKSHESKLIQCFQRIFYLEIIYPFNVKLSIKLHVFINKNKGDLEIYKNNERIGEISNAVPNFLSPRLLNEEITPIVTNVIYANGKISIYYENNILQISENKMLGMQGIFQCETVTQDKTKHEIAFPAEWVKNGTLVEYEVIGTICPIHNSSEACQQATTPNITCIWCEKWNTCIDSNHQDNHFFNVNDCHFKIPDVNDVSTSTPMNHKETTFGNTTFEITEESKQNKSLWYLYIVIPSVVFFFVACIGCVIWRWLHKRRRYNE
ncbi:hypothetical protein MS3_00007124 [Schistosoma haematobium]|uniref:Egg protein CP391S-like protein n=1 Tax=Schistosoma haematobium TaxID=6185 RepID=A0A922IT15_SCHHA|nr:hypothetical protein MS3_00007124 [Schistosoma haematobium]KAH9586082.1 hypothetical protein MS3_00007124 [Schistosoma haematobium]